MTKVELRRLRARERYAADPSLKKKSKAAYYARHAERLRLKEVENYRANRSDRLTYMSERHYERRVELDKLKDNPCCDCRNKFPPECMDYDHRPGETKLFSIGASTRRSWDALLAEIAKCDLVCSNCHRIRTFARLRAKKKVAT